MDIEFLSKFMGPLMVQSKLFKLVQSMISVGGPTNTQKDVLEFNQLHMSLVSIQLVRLSNKGSRVGLVWGAVPLRNTWGEQEVEEGVTWERALNWVSGPFVALTPKPDTHCEVVSYQILSSRGVFLESATTVMAQLVC
eukprot:1139345-Pelagomonas_calceolata.AAC.2